MGEPQNRQTRCSLTSSAGFSICSCVTARSSSSDERCKMVLDVMSLALTRSVCSGLGVGSSRIVPPCFLPIYLSNNCLSLNPFPAAQCDKCGLLLCRLLVATMPPADYLLPQQDFHCELPVVRWPFLTGQAIRGSDTIMGLRQFLKQRFIIFK